MKMPLSFAACIAVSVALATSAIAAAPDGAIKIVSATYGIRDAISQKDFTAKLQDVCGDDAKSCESFCTKTVVGETKNGFHIPFTAAPICRVVYRCASEVTRTAEAETGDTLFLNCRR